MDIEILIQKIQKLSTEVKAIKGAIKDLTPEPDDLKALKAKRKDLSQQIKDINDRIEKDLMEDEEIMNMKRDQVFKEEDLAEAKQQLFEELEKNGQEFSKTVQTENGLVQVDAMRSMKFFMNNKEVPNKLIRKAA